MMQWVLLVGAVVGLMMLSRLYPRVALSLFGGLVLALGIGAWFTTDLSEQQRGKVSVEAVSLENMVLVASYAGSYRLSGRVVNGEGDIDLDEVVLKVLMEDCENEQCVVVGQALERVNLSVPAGQGRDFHTSVNLGEPTIKGELRWRFEVTEVRS